MSEAEGHVLKQRMLAGKRAKAQRGELGMQLPMGYRRRLSGDVVKDPDELVEAATPGREDRTARTAPRSAR